MLLVLWPALVEAQLVEDFLAPGPLSTHHAKLSDVSGCYTCHIFGGALPDANCLSCHTEIKARLDAGSGFHGGMSEADRKQGCHHCHKEHKGRTASLFDWGEKGRSGFDHARTGHALKSTHGRLDCSRCHTPERVADATVRQMLSEQPGRTSFLGLPTACSECHREEHQPTLGTDCARCHDERAFRPAPGFDHEKVYPLQGKHADVGCDRCHPRSAGPRSSRQFKGVPRDCSGCHEDPHRGRLAGDCTSCHEPSGWDRLPQTVSVPELHRELGFALTGGHAKPGCDACHGTPRRPLADASCHSCHADAHPGQLGPLSSGKRGDCARCHDTDRFVPAKFDREEHAKTRFPLEGAHAAVACGRCHKDDAPAPRGLNLSQNPVRKPSRIRLALRRFERCEGCHADPHGGQLQPPPGAEQGCAGCHETSGWRRVRFDHEKSGFPLRGAHTSVACSACHPRVTQGQTRLIRYKPLESACSACHEDVHAGQFASQDGRSDCARCHSETSFRPSSFVHEPPFTQGRLEGKHADLACESCHQEVTLDRGAEGPVQVRRYRPLPTGCEGCHADFHRGALAGVQPGAGVVPGTPECALCHTVRGFDQPTFDHSRTGFALEGGHQGLECGRCHARAGEGRPPRRCAGCHVDAHRGELGQRCEGCHDDADSWTSRFDAQAHRRTGFPLRGRHAALPCEECHVGANERSFSRAATDCTTCHAREVLSAKSSAFDHGSGTVGHDCRDCHDSWRFRPARFEPHEACFPLRAGAHSGLECTTCHTRLEGAEVSGACDTGTAACTRCHEHRCERAREKHAQVPGFACEDRHCYSCHRDGRRP